MKRRSRAPAKRVLLLSLPFGALERPALGLSLLRPIVERAGFACDVGYLTFSFAEWIGEEEYRWISSDLPHTAFAGEWIFTAALYGDDPRRDEAYVQEILRDAWRLDESSVARLLAIRGHVERLLDHALAQFDWDRYGLVGLTSTFEQNLPSLAFARRLKALRPEIATVFGGANWEGEMGLELHRRFPCVDFVCSGEAEGSFPPLVAHVLSGGAEGRATALEAIPGLVFRRAHESIFTGAPPLTRDLDALPVPDFSDYFAALESSSAGISVLPTLLVETSRGCWWGAKSHCTFCGLNASAMTYRSKSGERAYDEIVGLADRWRVDQVAAVDNIFDMRFFTTLLPALARRENPLQIFYEVKANLSRRQVALLAKAGVRRIQPGIESLSDRILQLMRKGTLGLRNVQLLKWCREYGVEVDWNLLYGFPGERAEDYAEMIELARSIRFLPPPGACGPVRLDRFSPYFQHPESFGLTGVRPIAAYSHLYPFPPESLARIAYYFEFDYRPDVDPGGAAHGMIAFCEAWRHTPDPGVLRAEALAEGGLRLHDERGDDTGSIELSPFQAAIYRACDEVRTLAGILDHLAARFPGTAFDPVHLAEFLADMVAHRLMATDGKYYLSLALGAPPLPAPGAEEREEATSRRAA